MVGNGTSAVQIIPSIAPQVKELHVFQRRPAWVVEREQFKYSELAKKLFLYIPLLMWLYRAYIFIKYEIRHHVFKTNSYFAQIGKIFRIREYSPEHFQISISATRDSMELLKTQIPGDTNLQDAVTPQFKFGCKRLLVTNDYYPALNMPHCTVHNAKILKVNTNSITMENGITQELDVRPTYILIDFPFPYGTFICLNISASQLSTHF